MEVDFDSDFGGSIFIFSAEAFVNTGGGLVLHGLHRFGEHAHHYQFPVMFVTLCS